MGQEAFTELAGNAALLLAIVFVYDLALSNPLRSDSWPRNFLIGLGLAGITISVMQYTWVFEPGIVFDTRSVVIGITGLFFGTLPVCVVMAIASFARVLAGGAAAYTGVSVILASGLIGLIWRRSLNRPLSTLSLRDLLGLGLAVHFAMLALMFTLPFGTALKVVQAIALPVLTIYPAATAAVGFLMVNRLKRERAAEALQVSEDQYRTLFETMVQGVLCHEPHGVVVSANPAACTILGLPADQVVGRELFAEGWFRLGEDGSVVREEELAPSRAVLTGAPVEDMVLGLLRPAGGVRWVRTSSIPRFRAGEARPYLVYTVFEDITEARQSASEKANIQARLMQSQRMEALGLLAGGVAHDFNNLLTGILGNVALIREALAPASPQHKNVDLIETAARRAADLTHGLLTFSRGSVVRPLPVEANLAVTEISDLLRRTLPATVEIVHDFQPASWTILVDRTQLTQVLLNLAVNARDAMEGKGRLTLITRNRVVEPGALVHPFAGPGTEFVVLGVQDTGPGVAPEILQHLFEPFQTTKPFGSGTGLGLSIAYGAIRQAGGWISVDSSPEKGARFDVFLPRCTLSTVAAVGEAAVPRLECMGTILIVEDDPLLRDTVTSLLRREGFGVKLAENGAKALDLLRREREGVDLVLLDMTMPGLTVQETVKGIRALDGRLAILLNSGNAPGELVRGMLEAGVVQGFLAKPYDLRQLRESITRILTVSV